MAEFKIGRLRYTWKGVWTTGTFYNRDAVVSRSGKTYVCIEPHTSSDFDADLAYVSPEGQELPRWIIMIDGRSWTGTWKQNTYYAVDSIVDYGGVIYLCTSSHTSGTTIDFSKWTTYAQSVNWSKNWQPNTFYKVNDIVKYGGRVYQCTVQHTSANALSGLEVDESTKWAILNDGIEYKGEWNPNGIRYKTKDVVKFSSSLWIAKSGHTSTSTFDGVVWELWIPGLEFGTTWSPTTLYQLGDVVIYGGYSYQSRTINNIGNIPSTSTPNWEIVTTGYTIENEWNNTSEYVVGNVVNYSGQLFAAIKDNVGQPPSAYAVDVTYSETGSSGATIKVASTTGLKQGMVVTGPGFSRGQTILNIVDGETLELSEAPDGVLIDGSTITVGGINYIYWNLIVPGTTWKNRWTLGATYVIGDLAAQKNKTYKCVRDHVATVEVSPENDIENSTWVVYLAHDSRNVLDKAGDLITFGSGKTQELPIGPQGYLLKTVNGPLQWSDVFVTPSVFYVAPNGTDLPTSGTNWDRPWKTIKYACEQVANGALNPNAKFLIAENKEFIVEEVYQYMVYERTHGGTAFPNTLEFNEKAKRDSRFVIDAILYDISKGSNSQMVALTLSYFNRENSYQFTSPEVEANITYFIEVLGKVFEYVYNVINNVEVTPTYQSLNNEETTTQLIDSNYTVETNAEAFIQSLESILATALINGNSREVPPENEKLTTTIFVKTGTFKEDLPIVVPENTALVGDELRGVVVQPRVVINTIATRSFASNNTFVVGTTTGMEDGTPVQFVSMNSVNGINTVFGGVVAGTTYYVIGSSITPTTFQVSAEPNSTTPVTLVNFKSVMRVYGGQALSDMFRVRNGSGIRNMTLTGLLGTLTAQNQYLTRRPTGGSFVSLDPGADTSDTSAWIYRKSPYVQNVTNFGIGCTGLKIDGTLHAGGNKSVVCNDFTQIISDGIGIWCTGPGSLCEAVSVFSYYNYSGYFSEGGGRIRATNGNSSYGTFGVIAEGFDETEEPITGLVFNRYNEATASVVSSLGASAEILKIQYTHSGEGYSTPVTNLFKYSNLFTNWSTDGNVTLVQSIVSPFGFSDAWFVTGQTSGTDSSYIYQDVSVTPSGGVYNNVAGQNFGPGNGQSATFNVTVRSNEYVVAVNNQGTGYVVGNQIIISGSQLGGVNGVNDLIITVQSLDGSKILTVSWAGIVPTGSLHPYTVSIYCKKGNTTAFDMQAIFSGVETLTSTVNFNFNSLDFTASSPDNGLVVTQHSAIPLENNWYRVSFIVHDISALNTNLQVRIYPRGQFGNSGYSLFYGAQLETGLENNFYLETLDNRYESYADFKIVGAGSGVSVNGDEIRSGSVFQTRVVAEGNNVVGGSSYLVSSNNAQDGTPSTIVISASDVGTENQYLGMRIFINTGTGAGQYGYISSFDKTLKIATVLKESFDEVEITNANLDQLEVAASADINSLYVNQPIQFVPTRYTTNSDLVSQSSVTVTAVTGGTINTMTVSSTVRLAVNMPITFTGETYGGVTSEFTYYILDIIDDFTIQISTTLGGAVWLLNTGTGVMSLNYPSNTSYIRCDSTTHMDINLPITFTGTKFSDIDTGTTYYIHEVISPTVFTISDALTTFSATATDAVTDYITVDSSTGLTSMYPVRFSGTSFGGISVDQNYYINKIVNSTSITLASSLITKTATATSATGNLITVDSTIGFNVGYPIVFTGTTFGKIVNEKVYYISYVANETSFTISATSTPLSVTATATAVTTDQITVNSSTNLVPLFPITFSGTAFGGLSAGTTYYINRIIDNTHITVSSSIIPVSCTATTATTNLITVSDTTGFIVNNPIIFSGNTFGGLVSGTIYYILAINDGTTLTISSTPGGSAVTLTTASGTITARTPGANVTLTTASGSLVGLSVYTGVPVSLSNAIGEVIVRTPSNTVDLSAASGTLTGTTTSTKKTLSAGSGRLLTTFEVPLFGGITRGQTYYIKSIEYGAATKFNISETEGGAAVSLINSSGSMKIGEVGWDNINPGWPNVNNFDSTTVYYIEPRIKFAAPAFSHVSRNFVSQAPGTTYVSIKYGNGVYAALPSANATLATSTDSVNWSAVTLPTSASWKDMSYCSKHWVIISSGGTGIPGSKVLYSNSNLQTWKTSYLPSIGSWIKIAAGNGKFVAITSNGAAAVSTNNGASWTGSTMSADTYTGITYGAGKFIAISSTGNKAAVSTDGINWTTHSLPTVSGAVWSDIAFGNGRFVAVSSVLSKSVYSFNGVDWYTSVYAIAADKVAYGQGIFLALKASSSTAYISHGGFRWKFKTVDGGAYAALGFGFDNNGTGLFIASAENLASGRAISAGAMPQGRAIVSTESKVSEVQLWEPGSNYSSPPAVEIYDPNIKSPVGLSPRVGNFSLSNPTFISNGSGYNTTSTSITIRGSGYADDFQVGLTLICEDVSNLPSAGDSLKIGTSNTSYKVTSASILDGTAAPNIKASIQISPSLTVATAPAHGTPVSIRTKYSQARLTNHDYLNIGYGNYEESNYPDLPINTELSAQNEVVETNNGRVFYSSSDQDGNFKVGDLFAVEQATGIVTLSASQFGLQGLTQLKLGGIAVGGNSVVITQFSTDPTFVANSNSIISTQKAIRSYLTARLSQGGANTFTGQLIAGTVLIGGPDKISSTIAAGNEGSRVTIPVKVNIRGIPGGGVDGDAMATAFFTKQFFNR